MNNIWRAVYSIPYGFILFGIFFMRRRESALDYWFSLVLFVGLGMCIITTVQKIFFSSEHISFISEIIVFSTIVVIISVIFDEFIMWMIPIFQTFLGYIIGCVVGKKLKIHIDTSI